MAKIAKNSWKSKKRKKKKKKKRFKYLRNLILKVLFALAFVFLCYKMIFTPSKSSFHVNARTEKIEFTCYDENISNYVFYNASLSSYDSLLIPNFSGTVRLKSGTRVSFSRPGKSSLRIAFESPINTIPIIIHEESSIQDRKYFELKDSSINYIEILVPIDSTAISEDGNRYFAVDGDAKVGNNIDRQNWGERVALINEGELSVIGRSMFGKSYYESEKIQLYPGDLVSFVDDEVSAIKENHPDSIINILDLKGQGFVIIDTEPGMKVNYRRFATKAVVYKTGLKNEHSSYDFYTSRIDRLILDKTFHGFSLLIVVISMLAGFLSSYADYRQLNSKK